MSVGKTKDAGWEIGVSRTVPFPSEAVWRLLTSKRGTAIWLGAGATLATEKGKPYEAADGTSGEVRSFRPLDRIRLTWHPTGGHESTVQVAISGDGPKTRISFHQERLASAEERDRQRAHWSDVMDEIVAALER
jgi:uncharacterized protein YndB with AHSA1/START domain